MHRVELKVSGGFLRMAICFKWFLMHRVELKGDNWWRYLRFNQEFLMHRVELKAAKSVINIRIDIAFLMHRVELKAK